VDEGAVYTLAWLRVIGHPIFSGDRAAAWRAYVAGLWAATLDGVVRLDASDDVLGRRLRGRAKAHVLSNAPDAQVAAFSTHYRAAFDQVLADLGRYGMLSTRDFRTDEFSPDRIVQQILEVPAASRELVRG